MLTALPTAKTTQISTRRRMDKLTSVLVIYQKHHTVMKKNKFLTDTTWMNHTDNLNLKKKFF